MLLASMRFAMAIVLVRSVRADPVRAEAVLSVAVLTDAELAGLELAAAGLTGTVGGVDISITATCCGAPAAWPR
jgi:hypothetical protein